MNDRKLQIAWSVAWGILFLTLIALWALEPSSDDVILVSRWFAVILAGVLSATPWLESRSSLRSLLIAATIIALLLALVAWAGRS